MANRPYTVKTHDGKTVTFEAPEDAPREQLTTLAARALKAKYPDAAYRTPILDTDLRKRVGPDLSKEAQGSISTYNPTLTDKISDKVSSALEAFGVGDRYARHVGERTTSALADLTPVGAATEADAAKRAFGEGRYLPALGHGALAALSAVPEGGTAKAMFLGVMAKNADRAALVKAKGLLKSGADRKQIWNETGWFQGADDKWRFEVPDNAMYLDDVSDTGGSHLAESAMAGRRVPIGEVVGHKPLFEAYPSMADELAIDRGNLGPGYRGYLAPKQKKIAYSESLTDPEARSTVAHELQHAVQEREGFARGGSDKVFQQQKDMAMAQIKAVNDRLGELARQMDTVTDASTKAQLEREYQTLMDRKLNDLVPKAQMDTFGAYKRLAGEVEARNVQTRLDMTPGQRKEYAPWETEDVPREDQFVIWFDK